MLRKVFNYEMPDSLRIFMGSGSSSGQCSSNYGAYQSCTGLSTTNVCARGKGTDGSRKDGEKRFHRQ